MIDTPFGQARLIKNSFYKKDSKGFLVRHEYHLMHDGYLSHFVYNNHPYSYPTVVAYDHDYFCGGQ